MDATEKWNQQPLVQEEEEADLQALLHLKSKKIHTQTSSSRGLCVTSVELCIAKDLIIGTSEGKSEAKAKAEGA